MAPKLCAGGRCPNEILQNVPDSSKDACFVNSLLCYVKYRINLIHIDTLVKMCIDKFIEKELAGAQALLCNFGKPTERLQTRKGGDMITKAMYDII